MELHLRVLSESLSRGTKNYPPKFDPLTKEGYLRCFLKHVVIALIVGFRPVIFSKIIELCPPYFTLMLQLSSPTIYTQNAYAFVGFSIYNTWSLWKLRKELLSTKVVKGSTEHKIRGNLTRSIMVGIIVSTIFALTALIIASIEHIKFLAKIFLIDLSKVQSCQHTTIYDIVQVLANEVQKHYMCDPVQFRAKTVFEFSNIISTIISLLFCKHITVNDFEDDEDDMADNGDLFSKFSDKCFGKLDRILNTIEDKLTAIGIKVMNWGVIIWNLPVFQSITGQVCNDIAKNLKSKPRGANAQRFTEEEDVEAAWASGSSGETSRRASNQRRG